VAYYSNLAYEEEIQPIRRKKPQQNKTVKRNHKQMLNRSKNIRRMCAIVILAFSAGFMISKFVTVHETQQEIASLEKNLASIESNTSQQIFDLEQSVDLTEIEKEATNRLGMQRPEKYQTIYVNVKQDDVTEMTADEVEGFRNRVALMLKSLGSYIVELFSIE
jgi:cell division protein FtsL